MCVKIIISRLYHLMSPCIYYQNILLVRVFELPSFFPPLYGEGKSKLQKKLCKENKSSCCGQKSLHPTLNIFH